MIISREWAMPSHDTFSIKPIKEWVLRIRKEFNIIADPFARNCPLAGDLTNDLNPDTEAKYHMKAEDFLKLPEVQKADLVIFDPPYSLRQIKECYDQFGDGFNQKDSQNTVRWPVERDLISTFAKGVLSFGWSTSCMGKKRGYEIKEILLVAHGGGHNDTICTFEIKIEHQNDLFSLPPSDNEKKE